MRIISKVFSTFVTVALLAWLMPLGAFINSSQEKTACGGGRAFHMCTMGMSQAQDDPGPQKISFTNASGAEKTNKSASGSAGNDFTDAVFAAKAQDKTSFLDEQYLMLPRQLFFPIPTPIPKV